MPKAITRLMRLVPVLLIALLMVACESKVTMENFSKIQKGMSLAEVQTILGSSGEEDSSPGGMSISDSGVAGSSKGSTDRIYVWKGDGGATITVVIADGKVVEARQSGL